MVFYYIYILQSIENPDRRYVGMTRKLEKRLTAHNKGDSPSTKPYVPWRIETATAFRDLSKAAAFEQYLKSHSGRSFAKRHF